MEYRRRRRRKAGGPGAFGVLILLIVFAAAAKIIAGSGAIPELKARLTRSLISGCAAKTSEAPPATVYLQTPSPAPSPTGITKRIDLPALGFYAVQLGFYESLDECERDAEEMRALGAAGYVYDDNGSYRLLAAVYGDEASAESVVDQLKAQGRESLMFTLSANGVSLDVTSSEESSDKIEALFELCTVTPSELNEAAIDYDKNGHDKERLLSKLNALRADLHDALRSAPDGSGIMGFAEECLSGYGEAISETIGCEDERILSSAIKRACIKAGLIYRTFLTNLSIP